MAITIILTLLMVLAGVGGYYIGPGVGHYGAGVVCASLFLAILYRVFAGGPRRKGMVVTSELEGRPEKSSSWR